MNQGAVLEDWIVNNYGSLRNFVYEVLDIEDGEKRSYYDRLIKLKNKQAFLPKHEQEIKKYFGLDFGSIKKQVNQSSVFGDMYSDSQVYNLGKGNNGPTYEELLRRVKELEKQLKDKEMIIDLLTKKNG